MWCVADLDDEYVARMEDILALYEKPYSAAEPVVCLDEKPVSLHAEVRPVRPMRPGRPLRRDNEYQRRGIANLFAIVEPKAGKHLTRATPDRSARQFAVAVRDVVAAYPFANRIHLVMDNLNTHGVKSLTDHLGEQQGRYLWSRLQVHYTPKHGSWLNQAEIELSLVSRQCLGKRRLDSLTTLAPEIEAWRRTANKRGIKIEWQFTRKQARAKFGYVKKDFRRSET
jgi:transposase